MERKGEIHKQVSEGLEHESTVDDHEFKSRVVNKDTTQTRIRMTHKVAKLKQFSIFDRAGAHIWNAIIKDLEVAGKLKGEEDRYITEKLTATRYKIHRKKEKFANEHKDAKDEQIQMSGGYQCIGADGKRDKKTKICETVVIDGMEVEKRRTGSEEHQVYTSKPGGEYLDHSAITDGTCHGLGNDFLEVTAENNITETLRAILLDGCMSNVGWKSGLFVTVERNLGRQLLLLGCMLHANELDLRALFCHCDGGIGTTGPESFGGPLG